MNITEAQIERIESALIRGLHWVGPFDGRVVDVPARVLTVVFPLVATSTGAIGRSLAELEPEVRIDWATGSIVAPHDLALTLKEARYVRTDDGFKAVPSSPAGESPR